MPPSTRPKQNGLVYLTYTSSRSHKVVAANQHHLILGIETSLQSLTISPKHKASPVADSWEEEDIASDDDEAAAATTHKTSSIPSAPPPTPISPSARTWADDLSPYSPSSTRHPLNTNPSGSSSRPEKSTAVAGRMIAGALGVKTPKKSEEARAYERSVREQEAKRMAREREERVGAEERRQQVRRQIWED
ncbi:MAG: hypothetical protein Q9220_003386 [cf. Caloplaca sp. 1 TL-2023]